MKLDLDRRSKLLSRHWFAKAMASGTDANKEVKDRSDANEVDSSTIESHDVAAVAMESRDVIFQIVRSFF